MGLGLSSSPNSLYRQSTSPPGRKKLQVQAPKIVNVNVRKKSQRSQKLKSGLSPSPSHHYSRRKQWVLNPFRQEDEDEVLSKRNHNSRRWSHVFPQGEREFKRHAGPNFKSVSKNREQREDSLVTIFSHILLRLVLLAVSACNFACNDRCLPNRRGIEKEVQFEVL